MRETNRRGLGKVLVLASMITATGLSIGSPAVAASTATAYSGDAYGIGLFGVKVANGAVSISDTKLNEVGPFNAPTPQSGDSGVVAINFAASGLTATADTARSTVTQGNSASSASSALQTANVKVGTTNLVTANVLSANTTANCSGQSANSRVLGLNVAGQTVNSTVSPNTTVTVRQPLTNQIIATVTLNQQSSQSTATYKEATANALVVSFPANGALARLVQGTVVIAHAESDVRCADGPPPPPPPSVRLPLSAGYVDNNSHHPAFFPTPWQGDPGVTFVGNNCGRGTVDTCDGGALKIDNNTGAAITGVRVVVTIGSVVYDLWGSNTIPAGNSLVLTQTANYNFDTSETNNLDGRPCDPESTIPVVRVTINGVTQTYNDTAQILNQKGIDAEDCGFPNEGQPFQTIP